MGELKIFKIKTFNLIINLIQKTKKFYFKNPKKFNRVEHYLNK